MGSSSSALLLRGELTFRLTGQARSVPAGGGSRSVVGSASTSPSQAGQSLGSTTTGMRLCSGTISAFGRVVMIAQVPARSRLPPLRQLSQQPAKREGLTIGTRDRVRLLAAFDHLPFVECRCRHQAAPAGEGATIMPEVETVSARALIGRRLPWHPW